jgi:serine/threonine protein kinase
MGLPSGTELGPYKILSAIGAGGMGEVYEAYDNKLGRNVAIKVLPEAFANDAEAKELAERYGAVSLLDKMSLCSEMIPAIMRFSNNLHFSASA